MPVDRKNVSLWIKSYPGVFTYDGVTLYCQICEKVVKCEKKFLVDQVIIIRNLSYLLN